MNHAKKVTTEPNRNDKRPIAKFYRCWLEDVARGLPLQNCRGVNHEQYRAADRLICNYQRLFGGSNKGFVELTAEKNFNKTGKFDSQVDAMQHHAKVFGRLNTKSRQILEHFCLHEQPLRKFEQSQTPQWPKGAGSVRLREALDDLIEIYKKTGGCYQVKCNL
jgi:hypothetical protein